MTTNRNLSLLAPNVDAFGILKADGYILPTASTTTLGGVKVDGTTITINGSGVISGATTYTLPTATVGTSSTGTLGGVKVDGTTITISNGVISGANTYTLPTATTGTLGGVKVDGTTITVNPTTGVISGSTSLTATGVTAATYTNPILTVNSYGQVTAANNGMDQMTAVFIFGE